jgi:ubiquinone/menaquinone biosynthesis C-methylase UbiE
MPSEREVERIESVYAYYDAAGDVQRRRDRANPGNIRIARERDAAMEKLLLRRLTRSLEECRVLEIGCGRGDFLAWLNGLGVAESGLVGVDLLADRIESARRALPKMQFIQGNAEELQLPDSSFDLVLCITLFSSILDRGMSRNVAATVDRVLRPSGAVLWYDFRYRNPSNPHTRAMPRSAVSELFPTYQVQLQSTTLLPQLARRLGPLVRVFYPALSALPPLRTHYVGLLEKPAAG